MTDRTAPYQKFDNKTITRPVVIPGLTNKDGSPLTVDTTLDVQEIDSDWVSGILDYDYGSDPRVYGNHPHAEGPLRHWLPDAYPLPDYPATEKGVNTALRRMMGHHDLGGFIIHRPDAGRAVEIMPPDFQPGLGTEEYRRQCWFSTIREYLPFRADIWWDDAHDVARIRPFREDDSD